MDNQKACQCPQPDARRRKGATARRTKTADFRRFRHLARLMLLLPHQGFSAFGRMTMDKFEALAFAFGFIATGFLAFAASAPIA
jgi:hypothetical protein